MLKDPSAVLDYTIDWSEWLDADNLSTATWTVDAGLTSVLESNTTKAATIWLSGGVVGTSYMVSVRIVTAAGRTDDRTFQINVVNR
jgi:hypothetical protein